MCGVRGVYLRTKKDNTEHPVFGILCYPGNEVVEARHKAHQTEGHDTLLLQKTLSTEQNSLVNKIIKYHPIKCFLVDGTEMFPLDVKSRITTSKARTGKQ